MYNSKMVYFSPSWTNGSNIIIFIAVLGYGWPQCPLQLPSKRHYVWPLWRVWNHMWDIMKSMKSYERYTFPILAKEKDYCNNDVIYILVKPILHNATHIVFPHSHKVSKCNVTVIICIAKEWPWKNTPCVRSSNGKIHFM